MEEMCLKSRSENTEMEDLKNRRKEFQIFEPVTENTLLLISLNVSSSYI